MFRSILLSSALATGWAQSETILHYQVSDADSDTVAAGTVPGVDGSEDGQVAFGIVTLSEDIPSVGVPFSLGNRSLSFDGAAGINLPGTQQLLNSVLETEGGFTYEAWFRWGGGEVVNSIIDYAGTEKLVRESALETASYRNNSAAPLWDLGLAPQDEWHYAAVVFEPTGPVDAGGTITGNLSFYYDSTEATETVEAVTISEFGDSLNRTIAVGAHPLGFGGDFITGLIYEPRVSLGALEPDELLFSLEPPVDLEFTEIDYSPGDQTVRLTWASKESATYAMKYSGDLTSFALELANSLSMATDDEFPDDGNFFAKTFDLSFLSDEERENLFFRVEEE
ncbi:MAG: LamG-like jellyroll fold domain-containing protein [Akkermansiaceae bacterium]